MKCKECPYCQVRNQSLVVCSYDHTLIDINAYNKNKTMKCIMTDKEDETLKDVLLWRLMK
jgi:hypothetical protein